MESTAYLLVLECSGQIWSSEKWKKDIRPMIEPSHHIESAILRAVDVGIPSIRKRTFVVVVQKGRFLHTPKKLLAWKSFVERTHKGELSLGQFLNRTGTYFLDRRREGKHIFSFDEPCISILKSHIMGVKPTLDEYVPHESDSSNITQSGELSMEEFKKIQTSREANTIPCTIGPLRGPRRALCCTRRS